MDLAGGEVSIMTRTAIFPALLAALLGSPTACCPPKTCPVCPTSRRVVEPPPATAPRRRAEVQQWNLERCREMIGLMARQAAAHYRLTELTTWYVRTRGERSVRETLFVGREQLFSRKVLSWIAACLPKLADPLERRAAEHLRGYLAMSYVERRTAPLDDAIAAARIGATAKLPFLKSKVRYRDLPVLLSREKNAQRRAAISAAISRVQRRVLNPLLLKRLLRTHELAQWMKYRSYVQLSTRIRRVDLAPLIRLGDGFVRRTEAQNKRLLARVVQESLGKPFKQFRRADHARVFRAARVERHLPQALMIPAFRYFLQGIGLDMRTAAGTAIVVDDAMHPRKNPRAACFTIQVPADIRITVKPVGGLISWATLFHEGGHALHFAWTTTRRFAFRQLGSNSATEAFAELFARVWEEPEWLRRYQRFVREVNRGRHRELLGPGKRPRGVPVLTKKLMGYLIRHRLAYNLYLARRYGWAKLIYESVLHGGQPSLFQGVYSGQVSDRRKLYKTLFSRAYGYALGAADADGYLSDVDPFFYAADYARAFILADMLHEHLRAKFGPAWFSNKSVGPYLKTLWAAGNRYTAEEIAKRIGYDSFDYAATRKRLERLLGAAHHLTTGRALKKDAPAPPGHRSRPRRRPRRPPPCVPVPSQPGRCKIPR